jgi:cytochrome c-type biogenesis protein
MDAWVQSLADQAATASPLVMLVLVLFGGLVSSASPCVLAAVPLVVAAIGGQARTRSTSVKLSLAFALGMALCFTALGAIAAVTSSLMGDVGRGWKVLLGFILMAMGAQMAGFVHLRLPQMDGSRFQKAGLLGAFTLGALTGTLSAPCATPMLVVVLSLVAFQKKVAFGILLLLAYSLGHVVMLFLAGAFSGFASAYLQGKGARVGQWLHRAFGTTLVLAGLWILWAQLRSDPNPSVTAIPYGHGIPFPIA